MSTDEGRHLEGLDEQTERERWEEFHGTGDAVEDSVEALNDRNWFGGSPVDLAVLARTVIEAAMPAIRESIAQELDEATLAGNIHSGLDAARIVRDGAA